MNENQVRDIFARVNNLFQKAKNNVEWYKYSALNESTALTDALPGYDETMLSFGNYTVDKFAVLFVDMRNSTDRAKELGAEDTFLTMYAYIPAMLEAVIMNNGKVIDIAGDGIMALWKEGTGLGRFENVAQAAGICGMDIIQIKDEVTNKILKTEGIEPIDIGVGVSYGDVIVTKIGIPRKIYDVKAFGDCINEASHLSNGCNEVRVSKGVLAIWPRSKSGMLTFEHHNDHYILSRR